MEAKLLLLLDQTIASKFATSTLKSVVREYPCHPGHLLISQRDMISPRELHPVFYGCFDWHSCVHGYWQLARLCRLMPALPQRPAIEEQFATAFTAENLEVELKYFQHPERGGFERPYGWAWLLMLCDELSRHRGNSWRQWHQNLLGLGQLIARQFAAYLPKANYPVRAGTHPNSAFALTLSMEYARSHLDLKLQQIINQKGREWYSNDRDCQAWEPSQHDFLSPALVEALCMSRVMPAEEFSIWLSGFLPRLANRQPSAIFEPVLPSDRTDGQIAHLDGLNLSRAWCFNAIAGTCGGETEIAMILRSAAKDHLHASLPHIFDHYAGEHWLATFALLALTWV